MICCSCRFITCDPVSVCPECGSKFLISVFDGNGDPFAVIESAQCSGLWDRAHDLLLEYVNSGALTTPDYTLANAQIEWRQQCVERMMELSESMTGDALRATLIDEFEPFAAAWALDVYNKGKYGRLE